MRQHVIDLQDVISKGRITTTFVDNVLCLTAETQNTHFHQSEMPLTSFIQIPQKFKLPMRIDMRIKLDVPSAYLVVGKGHVSFGTLFLDNHRIGDILEPDAKKPFAFNNRMALDTFTDVTVIYDPHFMQIVVNHEERFFSKKEKYIKSPLLEAMNLEGLDLKIACSKQTHLSIASITMTEHESGELDGLRSRKMKTINEAVCLSIDKKTKADFEECISKLSSKLQNSLRSLNDYLLKQPQLKIKRKIEGTSQACKISYVSSHGFSYSVHVSENILDHFFWWYMVSNYTYEDKYMGRKNDLTSETLAKTAEESPDTTERLFSYYDECVGCTKECLVRTSYTYAGKTTAVCHGKMVMNMRCETFSDLQLMFSALAELMS